MPRPVHLALLAIPTHPKDVRYRITLPPMDAAGDKATVEPTGGTCLKEMPDDLRTACRVPMEAVHAVAFNCISTLIGDEEEEEEDGEA